MTNEQFRLLQGQIAHWRSAHPDTDSGELYHRKAEALATALIDRALLLEALKLAEDVLSRFPFTGDIWPDGTHPNSGIERIRSAILQAEVQ